MAIGFEFAIGWKVYKNQPIPQGATRPPKFGKAAVLLRTQHFSVTVDGDELEFVVRPVEETAYGESQLKSRMSMLTDWVAMLNREKTRRPEDALPGSKLAHLFPVAKGEGSDVILAKDFVLYQCDEDIAAIPQVTVGIRLGRIRKLMRVLGDENSQAAQTLLAANRNFYATLLNKVNVNHSRLIDSGWKDHKPSAKLRGLATMLALYIDRGIVPMQGTSINAVKYLMFMMSRTDFSGLFRQLPAGEQGHYRENPEAFVSYMCRDVMKLVRGNAVDPKGYLIEYLVDDRRNLKGDQRVRIPIRRDEWLKGIAAGSDLLTAAAHPLISAEDKTAWEDSNEGLGHRLRGLGGLGGKTDNVQYKGSHEGAAVVEFRARQNPLPHTEWTAYADKMYKFFHEINTGVRREKADLARAANV